jgi:O-antigen/teichoic acid export membrane protein
VLSNTGWNLLAAVLPLLAALWAMPWLASALGTERLGVLTLAWVLIGYFGLFEFGLGRALTKLVAERTAPRPLRVASQARAAAPGAAQARAAAQAELSSLCTTALALATAAGVVGAVLVALAGFWTPAWVGRVPEALRAEVQNAWWALALGVVPLVATAALRGALEGLQRFKVLAAIRVPSGVLLFAAPSLVALYTPRLDCAVASIVATRWLMLLAHAWPCQRALSLRWAGVQRRWVRPLLAMGGWLTVSNVVSPVMVYADRFFIAALVSSVALAHYAVPAEMVARLLLLPMALAGALFPALAAAQADAQGVAQSQALRRKALLALLASLLPVAALAAWLAPTLLHHWMGADFALHATTSTRILLLGLVFNAVAHLPFAALHGYGLAKQTALLHLLELPLYGLTLLLLLRTWGIEGAAMAWALRAAVDAVVLHGLLWRTEKARQALTPRFAVGAAP